MIACQWHDIAKRMSCQQNFDYSFSPSIKVMSQSAKFPHKTLKVFTTLNSEAISDALFFGGKDQEHYLDNKFFYNFCFREIEWGFNVIFPILKVKPVNNSQLFLYIDASPLGNLITLLRVSTNFWEIIRKFYLP